MLGVDEGSDTAGALRLGDDMERQGGLAAGLGAEDLDDPAARHAADPERDVQGDRAGRYGTDARVLVLPHAHDRAFTELLFDLPERNLQSLVLLDHRGT